jgi:hypothetical protein
MLWAISTMLTIQLFMSLAGDDGTSKVIMIALAVGLEGAKILTWRMGSGYRTIAISLIILSILASFGAALNVVEKHDASYAVISLTEAAEKDNAQAISRNIASIDNQINVLTQRLNNLPSNFVTAAGNINSEIDSLRTQRAEAIKQSQALVIKTPIPDTQDSMFSLFYKLSRIPESWIKLVLLMFLAVILEISIIVLTNDYSSCRIPTARECPTTPNSVRHENQHRTLNAALTIPASPIPAEERPIASYEAPRINPQSISFLKSMIDPETYPILKGRDNTAQELGTPAYQAKVIVEGLVGQGIIKVQGKRLVACVDHPVIKSLMAEVGHE